jgi:hypothetical protein
MDTAKKELDLGKALAGVDEEKRKTLARLIKAGAFMAPVVGSFAISGLTVASAQEGEPGLPSKPAPPKATPTPTPTPKSTPQPHLPPPPPPNPHKI